MEIIPSTMRSAPCLVTLKITTMSSSLFQISLVFFITIFSSPFANAAIDLKYPAVFNFGDSNSDTGNLIAAGIGDPLLSPNGQSFFHQPSGRFCDGRLITDFLMKGIGHGIPFLNPYLDSIGGPSFKKGCNFATAASTILPTPSSISPFSLGVQVAQFLEFKARALDILAKSKKMKKYVPPNDFFEKGLYTFDMGQNDLAIAFYSKTLDQILASIPAILRGFEDGIQALYEEGARNFWVHNTGPLGCLAQNVAKFGSDPSKVDGLGCVRAHNEAASLFNLQLHSLCNKLQAQYSDANIIYVDIFTIKSNLIANYSTNGFEQPLMACCGVGGPPLNYDSRVACGQTKVLNGTTVTATGCNNSNAYINWDGIHYTEAANQYVADQIMTGKYSDPPLADMMTFPLQLNV
ncbi:PREDICTED: GDSL esterase/lipase At1g54790-like [Ipomoea nil]|uniref:GDSL esterase/lipase At1g54790-like n=1 Tax=Ipomoea nil TaxID=35883 RepID=UPI000901733A|nr:PREDICTED: GDSL esterase/lipase At1g54790-like [Ipomoea nil]